MRLVNLLVYILHSVESSGGSLTSTPVDLGWTPYARNPAGQEADQAPGCTGSLPRGVRVQGHPRATARTRDRAPPEAPSGEEGKPPIPTRVKAFLCRMVFLASVGAMLSLDSPSLKAHSL